MERKAEEYEDDASKFMKEWKEVLKDKEGLRLMNNTMDSFGEMVKESVSSGNVFSGIRQDMMQLGQDIGGSLTEGISAGLGDLGAEINRILGPVGEALGNLMSEVARGVGNILDALDRPLPGTEGLMTPTGEQATPLWAIQTGIFAGLFGIPVGLGIVFANLFGMSYSPPPVTPTPGADPSTTVQPTGHGLIE